jgi:hypothetical protein
VCIDCGKTYIEHRKFLSTDKKSYCRPPDTRHWFILAEPAATPEAQIPECVQAPEIPWAERHAQLEVEYHEWEASQRAAGKLWREIGPYTEWVYRRLDMAESQLAALRVERDRLSIERDALKNALDLEKQFVVNLFTERDKALEDRDRAEEALHKVEDLALTLRVERDQAWAALRTIEESDYKCECDDHLAPDCCATVIGRDPGFFCARCFAGAIIARR